MEKVLNNLLGMDAKLRILNICEFEFRNNDRFYRRTEEDINEMIEDMDINREIYNTIEGLSMRIDTKTKEFISTEGNSFDFVDEEFINKRFMEDIRQNISHPEIKNVVKEELEFINQTILDLLKDIEN